MKLTNQTKKELRFIYESIVEFWLPIVIVMAGVYILTKYYNI